MNQNNRRQFLVALACTSVSLAPLSFGREPERRWCLGEVGWEAALNDVISDANAALAGAAIPPVYERGGPHWCMERALAREFKIG
jgi:hypothetical protein